MPVPRSSTWSTFPSVAGSVRVTGRDLAAFKAEVARLDALLGGISIAPIADRT